jgi:hypothetical protein
VMAGFLLDEAETIRGSVAARGQTFAAGSRTSAAHRRSVMQELPRRPLQSSWCRACLALV